MNSTTSRRRRRTALALLACAAAALSGCSVPNDPDGSYARIQDGVVRAGASPDSGLVVIDGDAVDGALPDLVEAFAAKNGATVEWTTGSEEVLVGMLEDGELDVVVGGITSDTPWVDRAGVTRAYPEIDGAGSRNVVMLVPLGENRLLSELEWFLDAELKR